MQDALCALPGFERGELERKLFPDGEKYRRILTDVNERDVVLLGGTVDDDATLEIYDLACALVHRGAHILTLTLPWFGYQTMERAVKPGEVVTAKTRARLLSSIPIAGSGNRVLLVDLHSEGITQYFSGSIRPVHLYAKRITLDLIRELGGDDFVLASTDAGRAKWVESLANDLGVQAGFVFKRRMAGDRTEVTALAADVEGKTVIIYDDMIRTGGSLLGAARAFLDSGATEIAAVTTHGVFPNGALERLRASGLLTCVACTDTHPRARELAAEDDPFLHVAPITPLLAEALLAGVRRHPITR
ncbi:MAG: ribose-phosphate pyrophosphokinase [Sandaracinus sp.]|nr:ribose-phosphate pyrophosphokinase [Sandaracinus sp.]MBJ73309.1 ribose-phosphate pyrophosphokinase [Sandaracinus sp.]